ncbi:hypothetical protein, partial [Aphanizomenon sp. UHCC 0183]|uniref:hypothetical protein n=1 Tax=Aphanizomenon sp. UHCC 0183 TaxID=2590028 RepID=UPI001C2C4398
MGNVYVSLRTACSSASLSPEASAITQHYQGFCWVWLSLNPTYISLTDQYCLTNPPQSIGYGVHTSYGITIIP